MDYRELTEPGYLYVLAHPSDPLLVKVGRTIQKPEARLAQHNNDYSKIAGQIVLDTGQEWVLIEVLEVPDPVHAETAFWSAAYWHPFRGKPKFEVVRMSDEALKKGLHAARKAGIRPPKSSKKRVRNRAGMIEQLVGTSLSMIGDYRGLVRKVEFECSNGHKFTASPGLVANMRYCPFCEGKWYPACKTEDSA